MPPVWLEGRAWLESAQLLRDPVYAGVGVPAGNGRPVMLIPGLLAGDVSLDLMRRWLKRAGFRPLRSGININVEASSVLVERIAERIRVRANGTKAIIIGQSRGGSLGFGLAQRYPELVERVITMGTPLADPLDIHPSTMAAVHGLRLVHTLRRGPRDIDDAFDLSVSQPPKVPTTSLYSRTDGIVSWRACLRPDIEAIEVGGSHVGMAVNRNAYREIARLLQDHG
ncbi:MAG: triacylglycerol lipase [Chloroflexota bacterium]|jgi:pimeloyl-ACP methyl ester carboxylesterase|nr:triacylglycerol lipase [Chloroflexota bacterium]